MNQKFRADDADITKKDAGCTDYYYDSESCKCGWLYGGDKSTANKCTTSGAGSSQAWDCRDADDYRTNGKCTVVGLYDYGVVRCYGGCIRIVIGIVIVVIGIFFFFLRRSR